MTSYKISITYHEIINEIKGQPYFVFTRILRTGNSCTAAMTNNKQTCTIKYSPYICTYLLPSCWVYIQQPCIIQHVVINISSTSDQQLWVLLPKVEAASTVGWPYPGPWNSSRIREFSPVLYSNMDQWFHAYFTCKSCWHGVKQHQQFTSGCHHTWHL